MRNLLLRSTAITACLIANVVLAVPLGTPTLPAGQNILRETGEVSVPALGSVSVVRYTWRDSANLPRSVSLVPASPATSGYAVHMSFPVGGATVYVNATADADGGFGYFVSHELYRRFVGGNPDGSQDGTISATYHAEDDSPFGRDLPSTGSDYSVAANQAVHEYRLNYRRWGTVASVPNPDPNGYQVSTNPNDHQLFILPVVIRWTFISGRDYPLWSVDYDLTSAADHIATDVRGPYGVMDFNEGIAPKVTALKWGDRYLFSADAAAQDFGPAAIPANGVNWTWNAVNNGRRYNVLAAGNYEFGIVDTVTAANSKYADGYADPAHRGSLKGAGASCAYGMLSMPCDYEWAYQSFQFDYSPTRPKLAWGSSPFLGSSITQAFNGIGSEPLIGAKGRISYGVRIVFGKSGLGAPETLTLATTPVEADSTLTVPAPSAGGTVSYTVLGDAAGPYTTSRTLTAWSSVRLTATAAAGYHLAFWGGDCAGVSGTTCMLAMESAKNVTATFAADASDPLGDDDNDGIPNGVEVAEGRNPLVKDNDVFGNARLFTMQQYRDFLGREGDAGGINFWVSFIGGGGTRAAVTESFFGSGEFQGTGAPVVRLYFAYFLRIPDYGGLTFWMNYSRAGHSLAEISNAFAGSSEFVNRYGALSNAQFVDLVYQNVLGRAADAGGKSFWLGQLNGGMSRGQMMIGFSESAEYLSTIFSETYVTMMYVGMLKREPDTGGFNFWVNYLDTGNSGQTLINGFLVAPEYYSRFLP